MKLDHGVLEVDLLEITFLVLPTGHQDILKIKDFFFPVLGEGPTHDVNDSVSEPERKFSINFTKEKKLT